MGTVRRLRRKGSQGKKAPSRCGTRLVNHEKGNNSITYLNKSAKGNYSKREK